MLDPDRGKALAVLSCFVGPLPSSLLPALEPSLSPCPKQSALLCREDTRQGSPGRTRRQGRTPVDPKKET